MREKFNERLINMIMIEEESSVLEAPDFVKLYLGEIIVHSSILYLLCLFLLWCKK